jgi:hypothetical protein
VKAKKGRNGPLAAIWWPAWRAASIDPVLLLKDE